MNKEFDFSEETFENTVEVIADEGLIGVRADAATAVVCEKLGLTVTRSAVQKLADSGALTKNGVPVQK